MSTEDSGRKRLQDLSKALQEKIARRYGFSVRAHKHEMYGVCSDCQKPKPGRRDPRTGRG